MTAREFIDTVGAQQSLELERFELRKAEALSQTLLKLRLARVGTKEEAVKICDDFMGYETETTSAKKDPYAGVQALWEKTNETAEVTDG